MSSKKSKSGEKMCSKYQKRISQLESQYQEKMFNANEKNTTLYEGINYLSILNEKDGIINNSKLNSQININSNNNINNNEDVFGKETYQFNNENVQTITDQKQIHSYKVENCYNTSQQYAQLEMEKQFQIPQSLSKETYQTDFNNNSQLQQSLFKQRQQQQQQLQNQFSEPDYIKGSANTVSTDDKILLTSQLKKRIIEEQKNDIPPQVQKILEKEQIEKPDFEKFEVIGIGKTATVYKSICYRTNKFFALKEFQPEYRSAFHTEFSTALNLQNALKKYGHLNKYINGFNRILNYRKLQIGYEYSQMDLEKFVLRYKNFGYQFTDRDIYYFLVQIKNLMEMFYRIGFVYTDLKPENLILSSEITEESIYSKDKYVQPYIPFILKFIDMGSFVNDILTQSYYFNEMTFDKSNPLKNRKDLEYLQIFMVAKCVGHIIGDLKLVENLKFREFLEDISVKHEDLEKKGLKAIDYEEFDDKIGNIFKEISQEQGKEEEYSLIKGQYIYDVKLQVVKQNQDQLEKFKETFKKSIKKDKLVKLMKIDVQLQPYYYYYLQNQPESIGNLMKLVKFQIKNGTLLDNVKNEKIGTNLDKIEEILKGEQKKNDELFDFQSVQKRYLDSIYESLNKQYNNSIQILFECLEKIQLDKESDMYIKYLKLKSQVLVKIYEIYNNNLNPEEQNFIFKSNNNNKTSTDINYIDEFLEEGMHIQEENKFYSLLIESNAIKGQSYPVVFSLTEKEKCTENSEHKGLRYFDKAISYYNKLIQEKGKQYAQNKGFLKIGEIYQGKATIFRKTFQDGKFSDFIRKFISQLRFYQNPTKIPILNKFIDIAQFHEGKWEKKKYLKMAHECENVIKVALQGGVIQEKSQYEKFLNNLHYRIAQQLVIVDPFQVVKYVDNMRFNNCSMCQYYAFKNEMDLLSGQLVLFQQQGEQQSLSEKEFIMGQNSLMNALHYQAYWYAVRQNFEESIECLDKIDEFFKNNSKLPTTMMKFAYQRLRVSVYFCQGEYDLCFQNINMEIYVSRVKMYCCADENKEYDIEDSTLKQDSVYAVNYLQDILFNYILAFLEKKGYSFNEELRRAQKIRSFQDRCLDVIEFVRQQGLFFGEIETLLIWTLQTFKFTKEQRCIFQEFFGDLIIMNKYSILEKLLYS